MGRIRNAGLQRGVESTYVELLRVTARPTATTKTNGNARDLRWLNKETSDGPLSPVRRIIRSDDHIRPQAGAATGACIRRTAPRPASPHCRCADRIPAATRRARGGELPAPRRPQVHGPGRARSRAPLSARVVRTPLKSRRLAMTTASTNVAPAAFA